MDQARPKFWQVILKTIVTHTITYFVMGLLASAFFNYASLYADTSLKFLMRPVNDPLTMAGPLFQPIRGALFGIVFYLLREVVFAKKNGWLVLWVVLLFVGVLGTFGPTPGSLEGMIYTTLPLDLQLKGLPEVVLQSLLLSAVLFYWVNHPEKRWLNWGMGILFFVLMLLPVLGLLVGQVK